MTNRRDFLRTAGVATAGAAALAAPAVHGQAPIKWRMQTYAGGPLAAHVITPAIEAFNKAANGEMEIELFFADQLVPTSELFRAMQRGTIDAVQSDDDSMASPTEVTVFGGYFPFASRFIDNNKTHNVGTTLVKFDQDMKKVISYSARANFSGARSKRDWSIAGKDIPRSDPTKLDLKLKGQEVCNHIDSMTWSVSYSTYTQQLSQGWTCNENSLLEIQFYAK